MPGASHGHRHRRGASGRRCRRRAQPNRRALGAAWLGAVDDDGGLGVELFALGGDQAVQVGDGVHGLRWLGSGDTGGAVAIGAAPQDVVLTGEGLSCPAPGAPGVTRASTRAG